MAKNSITTFTITKVLPKKKSMQVASFPDLRNTFAPSLKKKLSFAPKKQASAVSTLTKEHKETFYIKNVTFFLSVYCLMR